MTAAINYNIEEVCSMAKGQWLSKKKNDLLDYISLDSRKIPYPSRTVFWALSSKNRSGASFISSLYQQGVRNFVSEISPTDEVLQHCNVILVKDALKALHNFALFHRKKFPGLKVIGIAGSNGKTIVKEWLSELLSKDFNVVKSPRSFNSQIGVPLSILQIRGQHNIGIFEAGISKPGEMAALEKMILPQIGILTNIGSAHDEGFENRQQKIREKLLLFKRSKTIIYPAGLAISDGLNAMHFDSKNLLSWGNKNAQFIFSFRKKQPKETAIQIQTGKEKHEFQIPHTDNASIENAVSCFCALSTLNATNTEMLHRFGLLGSISMRLEMKPGIHQCSIINDSYSNDLHSLSVAIDFLNKQKHQSHTIILSDILQSGLPSKQLYAKVAGMLSEKNIGRLIGIGKEITNESHQFTSVSDRSFFENTNAFLENLSDFNFKNEAILLKGARIFEFEKISHVLEAQLHNTVLTINLSHLADNIRIYKQFLDPGTKLMVMVKALAYGAGPNEIASLMEFIRADYLGVAYIDEGIALREAGITLPIMVMNAEQTGFDTLIKYNLEPEIYSHESFDALSDFLFERKIKNYPVHIKIDTGMHRLGFVNNEIAALIGKLKGTNTVRMVSVFSHLSSSDNPGHDEFTKKQFALFKKITGRFKKSISYHFDCHLSNSSAISRFPEYQMDMVRLGIGMFGIDNNPEISDQLKITHRLTTTISQIKKVKAGEVVGYGKNVIESDKTIATVAIGYADGYARSLSYGVGKMYLHKKPAPVVGSVCMDMAMIDVTKIPEAAVGDEVEVFGENISIKSLAKWAKTIPYEILTGIPGRVKRIYIEG